MIGKTRHPAAASADAPRGVLHTRLPAGAFGHARQAPAPALANRSVPAREVLGAPIDTLAPAIPACADIAAMVALVEPMLLTNLPPPDPLAAQARALVARAAGDRGLLRAEQLAAHAGMGLRALQRLFRDYVGASPKWVIARYRLHEAVAQLQAGTELAWAELALALGYYDQAHFIRDFRRLVGCAPADYARRQNMR